VIEKYFGLPLGFNDIYLNVVGGMKLASRESDLSIIASLLSSYRSKPIDSSTVFVGEVGLTGEVRSIPQMEIRVKEMAQLNYKRIVTSEKTAKELKGKFDIEIIGIRQARDIESVINR
jgi:DNA repair protein RadA/Sms